ncbi:MAG: hypothetical protein AAF830_13430 [Pseudomonadota bacterium]
MSDKAQASPLDDDGRGWLARTWAAYSRPSMAGMLLLGFASGLPLYLVYQKTSFWLRLEGIERSTIGFFYWVGLFYSFKFIWAPIIDKIRLPGLGKLGHRRSWMVLSITGTVIGLATIATGDPSESLVPITIGALILAFSGATLDISIDAWRIESAPTELQANMAASYSLGYRLASFFSGLGFIIAGFANWNVSFLFMATAMAITGVLVLLVREPENKRKETPLDQLPWLAGPPHASASATFFFLAAKVALLTPVPEIVGLIFFGFGLFVLAAGKLICRGTWMPLPWRLLLAGLAVLWLIPADLLELTTGLPANQLLANSLLVLITFSALIAYAVSYVFAAKSLVGELSSIPDDLPRGRLYLVWIVPLVQTYQRYEVVLFGIFGLVLIYRLSDFTMGVMATPLYADLGYAAEVVGAVQSLPGIASTIVGLFIGGLAVQQFGLTRSLLIGSAITLVTNGAYAWFASVADGNDVGLLTLAVCSDNLAGGFVTTVFIAYLSSLVDPAFAATQYALFSSLYAFVNKFLAGYSGLMAEILGYTNFFLVTASYAIPGALLVMAVAWMMRRYPPKPIAQPEGASS